MKFLVAGDIILAEPWSKETDSRFQQVVDRVRSADIAAANLEVVLSSGIGHPQIESGGLHLTAPGQLAEELQWAGFNMVGHANNHSFDWGVAGLLQSVENLDRAGLINAGVGEDLQSARKPAFLEVKGKTVALVSMTTTLQRYARAGRSRHNVSGRPGVNPLEIRGSHLQTRIDSALCKGLDALGTCGIRWGGVPVLKPDEEDVKANLEEIKRAKREADFVMVSLHSHSRGAWRQRFARQAVETGADVVFIQGRHYVQGVEIYRGRPIFYGLGSIAMELQKFKHLPDSKYQAYSLGDDATESDLAQRLERVHQGPYYKNPRLWQGIIASFEFCDNSVSDISLIPIDMGCNRAGEKRGRPLWAERELGTDILRQVMRTSKRYGTRITIAGDDVLGTVKV